MVNVNPSTAANLLRALVVALAAVASILALSAVPALGQSTQGDPLPANFQVDDNDTECPDAAFTSIQDAVTAAPAGTDIEVCPGTYEEQVTITGPGKNNISLVSQESLEAEVNAPDGDLAEPGDLVTIDGATGVTISDFTISGPLPDSEFCSSELRSGVRVKGGGSATISGNYITEIRSANPDLRGCQNGFAIAVGRQSAGETGTATITDNQIELYQKGGIYADGTGTRVTARDNEIDGIGSTDDLAQNGIQVSRNATGALLNNRVFDNFYAGIPNQPGAEPGQASGIILFELSGDLLLRDNRANRNDTNIALYDVDDIRVTNNRANDATFYDGYYADADSTGNRFTRNRGSDNTEHDCHDVSEGDGTDGTANTWKDNQGETDKPNGICERRR